MTFKTLRLILGDQLNANHSWFSQKDDRIIYLIAEMQQEVSYVTHHIQKVCAFFSAMENFASALKQAGHQVHYITLDDPLSHQPLTTLIETLCQQYQCDQFEYQYPDEYRLQQQLQQLSLSATVTGVDSEHFLLPFDEINPPDRFAKYKMMEYFYRYMRKRFNVLMNEGKPEGGKWNFDAANRHALKAEDIQSLPEPKLFSNSVDSIVERLRRHKVATIGQVTPKLLWPTTRKQALDLLDHFCQTNLPLFGRFQDAMTAHSDQKWSLYHSRLAFALNSKMLHPMRVIETVLACYRDQSASQPIDLAQVEGFIRQILGWREFVRVIYWRHMPDYAHLNSLSATRALPAFFWHGQTKMHCLNQAITQSLEYGYAHHIQRLMITGNFCLLTGIEPSQVDDWYLGIYVDALEWVEMPNTRGMALFADGGIIATKPYAASGNYINKMSDYCRSCSYDVKAKTGCNACPMNSLYWRFMLQHRQRLAKNPRLGMLYRNWDKQSGSEQQAILDRAETCLANIEDL